MPAPRHPLLHWAWILLAVMGAAQGRDLGQDLPGAADIPGIPRLEGSVIIGYRASPFDETLIPTGPWDSRANAWKASLTQAGRRTRLLYLAPRDVTSLEAMQGYRQALEGQDYQAIYQCSGFKECGEKVERFYTDETQGKLLTDSHLLKYVFSDTSVREPRLYVGQRKSAEGDAHVLVFAAYQDNFADSEAGDRVAIFIEAVLSEPMRDRRALVEAQEMVKGIAEGGRIAIHGILFDVGQAVIKPESRPQIEEMARMLGEQPELSLYIVGHTDNQGELDDTIDLSRRRAEAVVQTLIESYGVLGERLKPMGVGALAPMATNTTEEGRALNRRVEMVAR